MHIELKEALKTIPLRQVELVKSQATELGKFLLTPISYVRRTRQQESMAQRALQMSIIPISFAAVMGFTQDNFWIGTAAAGAAYLTECWGLYD